MEYKHFPIEFVERTKTLIDEYEGDLEVSNILNCTLGLILLPYQMTEEEKRSRFRDLPLDEVKQKTEVKIRPRSGEYEIMDSAKLVGRVRNGLAHGHINPLSSEGTVTGVVIWDFDPRRNRCSENSEVKKFEKCAEVEIEFSVEGLRTFALLVAEIYLKRTQSEM